MEKRTFLLFFRKISLKSLELSSKVYTFASQNRDLAQLVAHTSGGREVAGSSPVIPTNARVKCLIFRHLIFFDTVFAQHLHNRGLFGIVKWCSEVLTNSTLHLRKILNVFFPFFGKVDVNPSERFCC